MSSSSTRRWRALLAALAVLALFATSCGGSSSDGEEASTNTTTTDETEAAEPEAEQEEAGGNTTESSIDTTEADEREEEAEPEEEAPEEEAMEEEEPEEEAMEEVAAPSGTLRYVEFSPVTTFDPAKSQTAQAVYLYPEYDTLTRQNADFSLEPSIATSWVTPEPGTWVFTIRDGVVFHDGTELDAQGVADSINYHGTLEGNPNGATWATFLGAEAAGDEVTVTFSLPQPQFPLEMSMVMGMVISPTAIANGVDMQRAPQGSGPWVWSDEESEAGVTEVFTLFEDYWDPSAQGVERIEATAVPDNTARLNALLTGETDIMSTTRDAQIDEVVASGATTISVPNFFPYIQMHGRGPDAPDGELLQDELIRQAIAYSIDRTAYNEAMHAGKGDDLGGVYPGAFGDWHVPALDDSFGYDPEKARELLAEAGYPDGITISSPIMPAIQAPVELMVQMLGSSGITVELIQINNGELGPRNRAGEFGISWGRELLYHPAATFRKYTAEDGVWNPFGLPDMKDLDDLMIQAAESPDLATQQELYGEVSTELINRGVIIPFAHGSQNGSFREGVTGVVLGLNMQAPMPYGVRVDG